MDRIYAGSNIRIELQADRWVLLLNTDTGDSVLAEAVSGQPLRYISAFGSQRRLPTGGQLQSHDIERVVLGWSAKDEAWHLGLMLTSALAQARNSRWCELAHWPDPTVKQHEEIALQAGRALAQRLARPFTMIPPSQNGASSSAAPIGVPVGASMGVSQAPISTAPVYNRPASDLLTDQRRPAAPAAPMPSLPLRFDLWTLSVLGRSRDNGAVAPGGLELRLSSIYGRGKLIRAAWYLLWVGVFLVLSITTLTSAIAQPRPEFLPYLGLGCAVFLLLLALANIIRAATHTKRMVISPAERRIAAGRGKRVGTGRGERWSYTRDELQGVYVSHIVNKVNRRRKKQPMRAVHYGELNLLLQNGSFVHLFAHGALDDKFPVLDPLLEDEDVPDLANEDTVKMLMPQEVQTPLQAAGLMIANALDVPCYVDQRVR